MDLKEVFDKDLNKQLFKISAVAFIFLLIILVKPKLGGKYIVDKRGHVVGIEHVREGAFEEYDLIAEVHRGDKSMSQNVKLKRHANDSPRQSGGDESKDIEAEMNASLGIAVSQIEEKTEKRIVLPTKLDDGSIVIWKKDNRANRDWIAIPLMYVVLVIAVIANKHDKMKRRGHEERNQILKALPSFTNQLLLMMNSGVILSDAFRKIRYGYSLMHRESLGELEKSIVEMTDVAEFTNQSIPLLFSEMARKYSVKELMRISTVLRENEKRGSDIQEKLERESEFLWDIRKTIAREQGKLIDTKMTYPLGMLLVLLIVITMAPALMTM